MAVSRVPVPRRMMPLLVPLLVPVQRRSSLRHLGLLQA
jgi:hypothetical protein